MQDLVRYKKLPLSENHSLDDKCCWGTAYRFKRNKWEDGVEEMIEKRHPEGHKQIKTTFYPMESYISYQCFTSLKLKLPTEFVIASLKMN